MSPLYLATHGMDDLLKTQELRRKLAKVCRLLFKMGLSAHSEGNVSCRFNEDTFFIKKTRGVFRAAKPEDFVSIDAGGKSLSQGEPSTEKLLHLEIYHHFPEINFVIHTHPIKFIKTSWLQEGFLELPKESQAFLITGDVPVIGPLPAGTRELAKGVVEKMKEENKKAVILREHGLVVASPSIEEAFDLTIFIDKISRSF